MPNLQFGTGGVFFQPSNANAPLLSNLSPVSPQLIQETSVEFKGDQKMLYGRKQFAAAVARGKVTSSGKGKLASFDPMLMNQLYFGMPTQQGGVAVADSEVHLMSSATSGLITVAPPNGGTFTVDLGVINGSTGIAMLRVTGTPTENQYSVSASGAYTFSASETAASVIISYSYTSTTGISFTITSQNMGYAPTFSMTLYNQFQGKRFGITLNSCTMTDFSIPTKQDDFWTSDISYSVQADPAGIVGTIFADQ